MSRILITGGLGYLGGRLSSFLHTNGHNVVISSRRSRSEIPDEVFNFVDDVVNLEEKLSSTESGVFLGSFDTIIHLAALNEIDCVKYPEEAMRVNVGDTVKILESALSAKVQRFIYLSTFHVYGSGINEEIDEEHSCRPVHPYSITHKSAEEFIQQAHDSGKIHGVILRLSNSFGAPAFSTADRWTLLVNDLCRQAIEEKRIELRSSGHQLRDFITLRDFCSAIELFLLSPMDNKTGGIFNVGSGVSTSVLDMAKLVAAVSREEFHLNPEMIIGEGGEENSKMRFNIDKLRNIGFNPLNDFRRAVYETLEFCKTASVK